MNISKDIVSYTFKPDTLSVDAIAFRKCKALKDLSFPPHLRYIGDAAFSLCPLLKQVTIPASVEHIGVAAFCGSGIETATFLGVPKEIEPSVFKGCEKLGKIVVPQGSKGYFSKFFKTELIQETGAAPAAVSHALQYHQQPSTDLFGEPIKSRCTLTYNYHDFSWAKGDVVKLDDLFSGPTALNGDPSYQFRRKCLFVFMKRRTASTITSSRQYTLPANTKHFTRKYAEKYGTRQARIILFVCDDGKNARFYDEVRFTGSDNNSIAVKSIL